MIKLSELQVGQTAFWNNRTYGHVFITRIWTNGELKFVQVGDSSKLWDYTHYQNIAAAIEVTLIPPGTQLPYITK